MIPFHGWGNETERRGSGCRPREQVAASLQGTRSPPAVSPLSVVTLALHSGCALELKGSTFISRSFLWKVRVVICIVVSFSVLQLPHLQNGNNNWFHTFVSENHVSYWIKGKHVKLLPTHRKYLVDVSNWLDYCFSDKNVSSCPAYLGTPKSWEPKVVLWASWVLGK